MVDITTQAAGQPEAPAHAGEVSPLAYAIITVLLTAFGVGVYFIGYPLVICAALFGAAFMLSAIVFVCYSK